MIVLQWICKFSCSIESPPNQLAGVGPIPAVATASTASAAPVGPVIIEPVETDILPDGDEAEANDEGPFWCNFLYSIQSAAVLPSALYSTRFCVHSD